MRKRSSFAVAAAAILAFAGPGLAQSHASHAPAAPFQPVSALVDLPDFIPGIGTLYVDPATLPAGPFLAYDRDGRLVSSIYMIPLAAMNEQRDFDGLALGAGEVDHVDILFNAGHPGVAEPHYHVVLWHVSPAESAALQ